MNLHLATTAIHWLKWKQLQKKIFLKRNQYRCTLTASSCSEQKDNLERNKNTNSFFCDFNKCDFMAGFHQNKKVRRKRRGFLPLIGESLVKKIRYKFKKQKKYHNSGICVRELIFKTSYCGLKCENNNNNNSCHHSAFFMGKSWIFFPALDLRFFSLYFFTAKKISSWQRFLSAGGPCLHFFPRIKCFLDTFFARIFCLK